MTKNSFIFIFIYLSSFFQQDVQQNPLKIQMKSSVSRCDGTSCQGQGRVQATCFSCNKLFCFQCSLQHAQQPQHKGHKMLELEQSMRQIERSSSDLLSRIRELRAHGQKENSIDRQQYNSKLHPEKFQQQLDEISFMKKETLKVVEKFFSQISLELVNMWEVYLKKYSSLDQNIERLTDLEKKVKPFTSSTNFRDSSTDLVIREYLSEDFERQVKFLKEKFANRVNQLKSIPACPSIRIDDRILVELSEVLCNAISTVNYTRAVETNKRGLSITQPSYLLSSVKQIPIFPIKKTHCYLFDLKSKSYEIQQFNNLDYLPDYPKTIVIPNGDIHIIGGVKKKEAILNTHLVFRSASSQVFKLADLPYAVNPANSLVYHNKFVYLIGGMVEKNEWTRRCIRYSLQQKQWSQISPLHSVKAYQSTSTFNDFIYCFGIPQNKKINVQRYDIANNQWQDITITNFLSNPFNFASGFVTLQINENDILFLGGKKFLENMASNKRSTDRELCPNIYLFRPETNSFVQLGRQHPCLGVQYGQFNPIIFGGSVFFSEYLLSKNNPIARWYDNLHMLQLTPEGVLESIAILNEE